MLFRSGSESNVKEIFDKCWELRESGQDLMIFNQFDEFGNYLWHYAVTGPAMVEAVQSIMGPNDVFRGVTLTTGSAGTIGSGDYLKQVFPTSVIAAGEAVQCPTILYNGFGEHRIEGIGDKHVPWVHNVKNTDFAIGLDDEATMSIGCGERRTLTRSPSRSSRPSCPSIVMIAPPPSVWTTTSTSESIGSTSGRCVSACGQIGVSTSASVPVSRIGPPAESEYAVDPVGVDTISPSA